MYICNKKHYTKKFVILFILLFCMALSSCGQAVEDEDRDIDYASEEVNLESQSSSQSKTEYYAEEVELLLASRELDVAELDAVVNTIHGSAGKLQDRLKSKNNESDGTLELKLSDIPEYSNQPYCVVNGNIPTISLDNVSGDSFEKYGELDSLGRCTTCIACIGKDLMPEEGRKYIGDIEPSGWSHQEFDSVEGGVLYNRCHLIAFQLTAEDANEHNLITGTRYMNVHGMLPFEIEVANYINKSGNHVLYQVTPLFEGDNLIADGVNIQALSVEDGGQEICFNVFCYNVQPEIEIDYKTGAASIAAIGAAVDAVELLDNSNEASDIGFITYVLNKNTMKFHYPDCSSVEDIKPSNREDTSLSRDEIIARGFSPCKRCNP